MKLLIIDGLNMVRRVYGANPSDDTTEKAQKACKNALSSFRKSLELHQPTHVLAAFDAGGSTWRHSLYPQYRINRSPMPQVLATELPFFRIKLEKYLGVKHVVIPGVEADDVIATLVHKWCEHFNPLEHSVVVQSTDKDLATLAAQPGVTVWNYFDNKAHDEAWCQAKYGIPLSMLADLLAMAGDSVDGIPGIPGIAEKTAAKLLRENGSLGAAIVSAHMGNTKLDARVVEFQAIAQLSRALVALKTNVQVGLSFKDLRWDSSLMVSPNSPARTKVIV